MRFWPLLMKNAMIHSMPVLDPAEPRTCAHFGVCGGCSCVISPEGKASPLPYAKELLGKEERVRHLLNGFDISLWKPILSSPDPWYYRNKMEFAFAPEPSPALRAPSPRGRGQTHEEPCLLPLGEEGGGRPDEGVVLGLREKGRFDRIVDLETCLLMSPEAEDLIHRVRAWAKRHQLSGYDRHCHRGQLRYLVVREGKNTGQRMVLLITSASPGLRPPSPDGRGAGGEALPLEDLRKTIEPLVTTAWMGIADSISDVARTRTMTLLWGPGYLEERLGDLQFRVSPYSFFQTNTRGTERLYGLLTDWARGSSGALLDLYCGSGGITLSLARSFDRVLGIDSNREAIEDAVFNAQRNNLNNTEFITGDAIDFMSKLPASKVAVQLSAVVVDPPRPGLHPKALKALVELNPPRLAYVSCNPESLARDLTTLVPFYKIQSVQPVDLFPHTPHVETVCLMEHR